jgi:hypothetical protein
MLRRRRAAGFHRCRAGRGARGSANRLREGRGDAVGRAYHADARSRAAHPSPVCSAAPAAATSLTRSRAVRSGPCPHASFPKCTWR